jgi:hypothetical protein
MTESVLTLIEDLPSASTTFYMQIHCGNGTALSKHSIGEQWRIVRSEKPPLRPALFSKCLGGEMALREECPTR